LRKQYRALVNDSRELLCHIGSIDRPKAHVCDLAAESNIRAPLLTKESLSVACRKDQSGVKEL
jgi:hypothetical protein